MKRIGVREFGDQATQLLLGDEVVEVERDGRSVGIYIPSHRDQSSTNKYIVSTKAPKAEADEALARFEEMVKRVMAETGLTEDELSDLFNLNIPLPEHVLQRLRVGSDERAAGG